MSLDYAEMLEMESDATQFVCAERVDGSTSQSQVGFSAKSVHATAPRSHKVNRDISE